MVLMLAQTKTERGSSSKMEAMKLHLGCGKVYIPGFIHIDLADYPHVDYKNDISCLPMFANNSIDLIYCCHALKPGGILRLAVPDFAAIVKVYLKYKDLAHQGILGPLYGRMGMKTADGEKVIYHKTTYDFASLKTALEAAGFKNIHRYDWRQTIHKDYDDFSQAYIPHLDKEHGILISLNVEAEKL
jgi:predicted SAM-dependent methyltransferase